MARYDCVHLKDTSPIIFDFQCSCFIRQSAQKFPGVEPTSLNLYATVHIFIDINDNNIMHLCRHLCCLLMSALM